VEPIPGLFEDEEDHEGEDEAETDDEGERDDRHGGRGKRMGQDGGER
jgi:hypothetical protein